MVWKMMSRLDGRSQNGYLEWGFDHHILLYLLSHTCFFPQKMWISYDTYDFMGFKNHKWGSTQKLGFRRDPGELTVSPAGIVSISISKLWYYVKVFDVLNGNSGNYGNYGPRMIISNYGTMVLWSWGLTFFHYGNFSASYRIRALRADDDRRSPRGSKQIRRRDVWPRGPMDLLPGLVN